MQQTTTWLGPPMDPPEVNDVKVDEQRRDAALETRRRATRSAQWSAVGMDHAQLLPECDAVCARTPRDRVVVMQMTT